MPTPTSRSAPPLAVAPALAMLCACAASPARADWPQFRGPDGQGHATGANPPTRWSDEEHVVWRVPVPGGWSSPVVQGGRVYLSTAKPLEGGGHALGLLCLDARTGGTVWDRELFRQDAAVKIHDKNSHASPTPVAAGDRIFVHFGTHGTACVRTDGEPVWKRTLPYAPQHGNGGSPALVGDVLVICCDGADRQFVVGLDAATGVDRWNTSRDTKPVKGFSFCTPLAIDMGGKPQVVCPGSDAVFAYEPASGAEIWRVDYPQGYSVVPRPVYACGLVFVCSGYDRPVLHAIDPTGRGNVSATHVRWRLDRAAPNTPSVLVVGDELYCVSDGGVATCVDARTGKEHWRERLGGNFSASPLHAAGHVYFQNEAGEAIVVKAGTVFAEVARNRLGDGARTFASYAVDGDDLLVRSESTLYRIGR